MITTPLIYQYPALSDPSLLTRVCSLGGSTLSEIKQDLKDGKIDTGVDKSKVDIVVLHLGSHEWDSSEDMVKSADSVFVE